MTFLQWLKKHKKDSEETELLAKIILHDKEKPKRCKQMSKWIDYLKAKNPEWETVRAFHQVWKRFSIHTKLTEIGEVAKRTDEFLDNFRGSKEDTILFTKIISVLENLGWEVTKEKNWLYLGHNDWDQIFFRPSENGRGFVILSEYSLPEFIPYEASSSDIQGRLAHLLEFNEAYRLKYHEEIN